jgi:predicted PurR-regulated permease PerM
MGRTMKLHAFVILVALAVGTALSGLIGAVLAVPVTAAVWGIVQVWDGPHLPARWARRRTREPQPSTSTAVEVA